MLGAGHTDSTPLRSKRPEGIVEQEDGASGIDFSQYKQSSNFKKESAFSRSKEAAMTLSKSARDLLKKKQSHIVRYFDATREEHDLSPKVVPK